MRNYIILSVGYRFLCGALLLAINWGLATNSNDNFSFLAAATVISFIPALFVPLFSKKILQKHSGSRITAVGMLGIIISCILLSGFHTNNTLVVIINFIIWIFFFLLESSLEMWFVSCSKNYPEPRVLKFSSMSMSSNQAALMAGPIAASLAIKIIGVSNFYLSLSVLYMVLAGFSFQQNNQIIVNNISSQSKITKFNPLLFLALAMIWPVLGSFNFMLPVHINISHGKMIDVGILDAFMGIGMAMIGAIFSMSQKVTEVDKIIVSFLCIFSSLLIWIMNSYNIYINGIAIAFLGFGFGGLRILLRSIIANHYTSAEVGVLVSRANACALPILACTLVIVKNTPTYIWLAPYFLSLLMAIFLYVGFNVKNITLLNKHECV